MGQANKHGTFSQRLAIAIEVKQQIAKLVPMEDASKEYAGVYAKQLIIEHWKRSNISNRAAFSSGIVWS